MAFVKKKSIKNSVNFQRNTLKPKNVKKGGDGKRLCKKIMRVLIILYPKLFIQSSPYEACGIREDGLLPRQLQ